MLLKAWIARPAIGSHLTSARLNMTRWQTGEHRCDQRVENSSARVKRQSTEFLGRWDLIWCRFPSANGATEPLLLSALLPLKLFNCANPENEMGTLACLPCEQGCDFPTGWCRAVAAR